MSIINPYRYAAAFVCDAVVFDAANDYISRGADWTGNANSKLALVSFWVKLNGSNGSLLAFISGQDGDIDVGRTAADKVNTLYGASGSDAWNAGDMNTTFQSGSSWRHLIWSLNAATSRRQFYIDGVTDGGSPTGSDVDVDWTVTNHFFGANPAGNFKLDADVAEVYINNEASLDLSTASNLEKFRSSDGKPVDLGADGSTPTGSVPKVYLHIDDGESAANFVTNAGDGGNYSVTGSLATASTSPSD
jgi:hypothetical protein